jgi:hypothetical protein
MDADRLREAYVERFGALYAADTFGPEGPRDAPCFYLLSFWDPDVPAAPVVYATFGAPGRELLAASVAPISGLGGALLQVAIQGPVVLSPYQLLEVEVERTPFDGLLVAPPEDGSFFVEEAGGGRRAVYRLIPITRGERALAAERDPREVYRRVRAADALITDPLRDCTVTPQRTALWRISEGPVRMRELSEHLDAVELRIERLRARPDRRQELASYEREAPETRAYVRHLERGLPFLPAAGEWVVAAGAPLHERLARLGDVLVERSLENLRGLVAEVLCVGIAEMVSLTIHTHPEALRLVETLLGEAILPPVCEGSDAVARACAQRIVAFDGRIRRALGPDEVERRVRRGIDGAPGKLAPKDEIPYENHVWACMAEAVHEGAHDTSRADGRAMADAFRDGIDRSRRLEPEPSTAPPFPRLVEIVRSTSLSMFLAYYAAVKRARDN